MSLLIKGMDMPRCCKECGLLIDEDFSCAVNQYLRWRDWSEVPEYISAGCPLIEIPTPHGRLIDADRLLRKCQKVSTQAWKMKLHADVEITMNQFIDFVKQAPTVIEKEMKQ